MVKGGRVALSDLDAGSFTKRNDRYAFQYVALEVGLLARV